MFLGDVFVCVCVFYDLRDIVKLVYCMRVKHPIGYQMTFVFEGVILSAQPRERDKNRGRERESDRNRESKRDM